MQTVKCLQNQDAPENPEKYQMKAHFLLSSVVYNICQQKFQKYFVINVWRKSVFDIYFTEFGAALTKCFTCFVQVLL